MVKGTYYIVCCEDKENVNFGDKSSTKSLFGFPKSPRRRQKWLSILKISEDMIKSGTRVCEHHFKKSAFVRTRLKRDAVSSKRSLFEEKHEGHREPSYARVNESQVSPAGIQISQLFSTFGGPHVQLIQPPQTLPVLLPSPVYHPIMEPQPLLVPRPFTEFTQMLRLKTETSTNNRPKLPEKFQGEKLTKAKKQARLDKKKILRLKARVSDLKRRLKEQVDVSDTDSVLGIVQANANKARVFALGIGEGACHHLVEGLAKAGGGTSAFVTYNEPIQTKVLNQLKNGLQPSMTDVELEWEGITPAPTSTPVINRTKTLLGYGKPIIQTMPSTSNGFIRQESQHRQSPKRIPPVHDGSQMVVFGLFQDGCPKSVTIKAESPDGPLTFELELSPENDMGKTGILHRLAAIKLVRELELEVAALLFQGGKEADIEMKKLEKVIVEISCEYGIASRYTSFVAIDVEENTPAEDSWMINRNIPKQCPSLSLEMKTRPVPSQVPLGWHGERRQFATKAARRSAPATPSPFRQQQVARKSTGGYKHRDRGVCYGFSPPEREQRSAKTFDHGTPDRGVLVAYSEGAPRKTKGVMPTLMRSSRTGRLGRKTKTPKPTLKKEASPLLWLTTLQSYDGSYTLSSELTKLVGRSLQEIKAANKQNLRDEVFATALAICIFQTKMKTEREDWELVVLKARKWLSKAVQPEQVDGTIQVAMDFLQA